APLMTCGARPPGDNRSDNLEGCGKSAAHAQPSERGGTLYPRAPFGNPYERQPPMTGMVLITGMLFARPEKRILTNGSQCVMAIVKSREGNHTRLWHIAAFNRAVQLTLLQLSEGVPAASLPNALLACISVAKSVRGTARLPRKRHARAFPQPAGLAAQ